MKKQTTVIIGILLVLPLVLGVGFSPSSLIYNLEKGQQDCQIVSIISDSDTISIEDKWAENKDIEWKVELFETSASEHGISINYPSSTIENEIEVCLSGNNVGEYHGVLLLREEQEGNTIIRAGIWLKAIINEEEQEETTSPSSSTGSSGGGGSVIIKEENKTIEEEEKETIKLEEDNQPKIQGSVIGDGVKKGGIIIGIVLVAILVIQAILYVRRKI